MKDNLWQLQFKNSMHLLHWFLLHSSRDHNKVVISNLVSILYNIM